jgi:hypothetical protein
VSIVNILDLWHRGLKPRTEPPLKGVDHSPFSRLALALIAGQVWIYLYGFRMGCDRKIIYDAMAIKYSVNLNGPDDVTSRRKSQFLRVESEKEVLV